MLGSALVSWFRGLNRHEERKEVVHNVGSRNTRDICMVIRRCDFDDVRAAEEEKSEYQRVKNATNAHEVEACKTPDNAFDLTRCPATRLWRPSCEK